MKNKRLKIIIAVLLICIVVCSFVSYAQFDVANPLKTVPALAQIMFTDTEYVEIRQYPKVIIAKPTVSLEDYMQERGLVKDEVGQLGALHKFVIADQPDREADIVLYSVNKYYAKWRWQ